MIFETLIHFLLYLSF